MNLLENIYIRNIIFILPSWIANASPLIIAKIIHKRHPIDFNKNFIDGRRFFGKNKSIEGFIFGIICGIITGIFLASLNLHTIYGASILSFGALLGDLFGSFIKRRLRMKSGDPFPIIDQLMFLLIALALYSIIIKPVTLFSLIFLSISTLILHIITNFIAYKINLKTHPW